MSSHLVDGILLPDHVAGQVALEFCNTRAGWGAPESREYLTSPRALQVWAGEHLRRELAASGLVPQAQVLPAALRLRESLYSCALGRGSRDDWTTVSTAISQAHAAAVLEPGPDGEPAQWQLRSAIHAGHGILHAVALAAEQLLTTSLHTAVAACPGDGCGWLFVDPRGRRRWCSMAVCGNRAKARRHAERARG